MARMDRYDRSFADDWTRRDRQERQQRYGWTGTERGRPASSRFGSGNDYDRAYGGDQPYRVSPDQSPTYGRQGDEMVQRWARRYGYDIGFEVRPDRTGDRMSGGRFDESRFGQRERYRGEPSRPPQRWAQRPDRGVGEPGRYSW